MSRREEGVCSIKPKEVGNKRFSSKPAVTRNLSEGL